MPRGKKFTAEQIIGKRRGDEVELARGQTLPKAVRRPCGTEQTNDRWKREYGGLPTDQAKRLTDREKGSGRVFRKPSIAGENMWECLVIDGSRGRP